MDEHRPRDAGFTLTETIVVVLLVSVLASVIVGVVAVISRTAPSTEASVERSRSYQGLITWLPRDAASTPPGGFVTSTVPASPQCAGISGDVLVQMSWLGVDGTEYVAGYRLQPDGDGQRVQRYTCSGTGSGPFPSTATRDVTSRVSLVNDVGSVQELLDGTDVIGIRIELKTCGTDGRRTDCTLPGPVVSVAATSRNPGPTNTLPPP